MRTTEERLAEAIGEAWGRVGITPSMTTFAAGFREGVAWAYENMNAGRPDGTTPFVVPVPAPASETPAAATGDRSTSIPDDAAVPSLVEEALRIVDAAGPAGIAMLDVLNELSHRQGIPRNARTDDTLRKNFYRRTRRGELVRTGDLYRMGRTA